MVYFCPFLHIVCLLDVAFVSVPITEKELTEFVENQSALYLQLGCIAAKSLPVGVCDSFLQATDSLMQ